MAVLPAPNPQNMRSIRWEAVNGVLMRRSQPGRPSSLLIDPGCVTLITGLSGGYFMRRLRISGERYADEPEKNQYSHVCEAFENQLLGGGEGKAIFTSTCASCHTLKAAGASGEVGPNLDELMPDDATVEKQVTNGGGGMPAFGGTLTPEEIEEVAAFVSTEAGK